MNRPDFSNFLAHFTKDGAFCNAEQDKEISTIANQTARDRLVSILQHKRISATNMPWTNLPCVCFTECPWNSLLAHTKRYSSYGIGFTKAFIFKKKGSPALYLRVNIFKKYRKRKKMSKEEKEWWVFATPFSPSYRNKYEKGLLKTVDYTHEREWRLPKDLTFEYADIAFIIVKTLSDLQNFPEEIQTSLKDNGVKVLVMDNYRLIEELWPLHIM